MRELKFRAWDVRSKKMCEIWEIQWLQNAWVEQINARGMKPWSMEDDGKSQMPILMQYTGLKDKNGKEIYEGDIVLIEDTYTETVDVGVGNVPVAQTPDNHLAPVLFRGGVFGVRIEENGEIYDKGFHSFCDLRRENDDTPDKLEVIGNIYENPELLK